MDPRCREQAFVELRGLWPWAGRLAGQMIYQMNSGSTMNEAHCPGEGKNDVVADLNEFEGRSKDDGPD
jgi:hypothetical protein